MAVQRIRFKGRDDLILSGGAITTIDAYERFECSYAHLFPDGVVRRFGVEIGKESDVTILNEVEAVCGSRAKPSAIVDALLGGWQKAKEDELSDAELRERKFHGKPKEEE